MKNLLKALHAAMSEMADPKKNSTNPAFRNKYADLGAVLESIEGPLQRHGLILLQMLDQSGTETVLQTQLWHVESGEQLQSNVVLRPEKATPQGLGSCISYMRRYAIKAMFALSDTDDDGNEATRPTQKVQTRKPSEIVQTVAKAVNGTVLSGMEIAGMMRDSVSIEGLDKLAAMARQLPDNEKAEVRAVYLDMKSKLEAK